MLFTNAFRFFMENFKNIYKILLYKIVVGVIAAALYSALLLPQLIEIFESAQMIGLWNELKGFFVALLDGADNLHALRDGIADSVKSVVSLIASKALFLIISVALCGVVYLLTRFVDTLCYFSVGDILSDKMETFAETPFWSSYIKNLGRGSAYSAVYVIFVFLFDVSIVLGCYFLFFYLLSFLSVIIAVFLSVTSIILANALKLTFTSMWLPAMTADGLPLRKALKSWKNVGKKPRSGVFSTYLISIYFLLTVNIVGAVCTFGSSLLITFPASYFFLICLQYVNYYTLTGKKYFLTHEQIVKNETHGDESLAVEFIAEVAAKESEQIEAQSVKNVKE